MNDEKKLIERTYKQTLRLQKIFNEGAKAATTLSDKIQMQRAQKDAGKAAHFLRLRIFDAEVAGEFIASKRKNNT